MQRPKKDLYNRDAKAKTAWLRRQLELHGRTFPHHRTTAAGQVSDLYGCARLFGMFFERDLGRFKQTCTRGRVMRPSHLFGKCVCHVCKLAEFADLGDRRLHCISCGYCMFLLCPKTFELSWNYKEKFKQKTYNCTRDSDTLSSCIRRKRETHRFMLWLCWTHLHGAQAGLGKLPRVLIKIISKLMC